MTYKQKIKNRRLGPDGSQNKITASIKQKIIDGVYKPNSKIPPRLELEKQYNTSRMTIQKVFDKLKKDGFVKPCGAKGTLVTQYPPCFSNYGIIFSYHLGSEHTETSFYNILKHRILNYSNEERSFSIYQGLNGHTDETDYIRLYQDLQDEKLAGLIFTTNPKSLFNTPLFKYISAKKHLAKVAFSAPIKEFNIPVITGPSIKAEKEILDFLQQKGIKRLAVVDLQKSLKQGLQTTTQTHILQLISKYNIELPRRNFQVRHPFLTDRTDELVEMMLSCPKKERPDALWIANDALVEPATRGILAAGIKVPQDMIVISHCNFPEKPFSHLPTSWYGIDVNKFIDLAMNIMHRQHKKKHVKKTNILNYEFEFISSAEQ